MTPELIAKATEAGVDVTGLELKSMKALAHMNKITAIVGGEETYKAMVTDMSVDMSQEQKDAFTRDLSSSNSDYTVKGMYADWQAKTNGAQPQGRVSGRPANQGSVKPYANQSEMLKDSARARNDKPFRQVYEARKAVTQDSVFFNR